ncbi:MAG: heat shock protein HtpX [Chloroflexota bacterium]|nr:heat shock protein HtpX [Chloroflexota bacterium]
MASTFYSQIAANKRNSVLLAIGLILLLAILGLAIGYGLTGSLSGGVSATVLALFVGVLVSLVSYFQGDSIVLAASGARAVTEEEFPQLFNVVRELTIAGNLPMPKVYLIDDTSMNAFATGRDPQHASIAVTSGLLSRMDREEVQGVIAHELSHVRNFDIRFSLLVGVMVGSIALLADFFLRFTFWGGRGRSSDNDKGGGAFQLIILAVALVLAILAPIAARLVQLAVSRQREYLADASGVELTRNPVGLERALATIAGDTEVLEVANRATQHLYFTNPIMKLGQTGETSSWFATHPRLIDRINRLRQLRGLTPVETPAEELASSGQ